jgi:hypothetical protein
VGALDLAALERIAVRVRAIGLRAAVYGPS